MKQAEPPLSRSAVRIFACLLGLLLLSWPLISIAGSRGLFAMFGYVFTVWLALVLVLVLIGRAARRERKGSRGEPL